MAEYRAKKRLGQNFLISEKIIARIIELVNPTADSIVVEVGPGQGALTKPLAASKAQVWGIEFDRDLIRGLENSLLDFPNVTILNRDFLAFRPEDHEITSFILTGNLPYNITSPVIDWCIQYRDRIERAVFMIQREMAERITGSPGSRNWSPLSIFTQIHFDTTHCFDVPPAAFVPQPEVTSSVIKLTPHKRIVIQDPGFFDKVVRASFTQRRKLLLNNLVPDFIPSNDAGKKLLAELGLADLTRAEEVTIPQFIHLSERLSALREQLH
jgi:16S rRNA (adenine1518-N6/adenine1519-N6)-dimethyltransferase